jgi:hypothetical protein
MKNLGKLAILGAVLATASFAFGSTINLGSWGIDANNGSANTANPFALALESDMAYGGFNSTSPYNAANPYAYISTGATPTTYNIPVGSPAVWAGPIGSSSWISQNPNSYPGGSVTPADGYYTFTTTFTAATAGLYTGTMTLLADDTVAVFVNTASTPIIGAGAVGGDGRCSDNAPTCTLFDGVNSDLFTFDPTLVSGLNTLTFVVEQTGAASEGVDFTATIAPAIPEPSSLMLLGTGLLGVGGMLMRRRRATA